MMIIRPTTVFIPDDGELNILGKPYTHEERVFGVILCIIQAIILSVNFLLIKNMGKQVHPLTLIIFILVACILFSPIFMFYNGMTKLNWTNIYYIFLMGIAYFYSQFFMYKSY